LSQVSIGVLSGLAVVLTIGRLIIRFLTRRRLYVDDGFLSVACILLLASTIIFYQRCYYEYIEQGILTSVPSSVGEAVKNMDQMLEQNSWELTNHLLFWTAAFAVKWSYFALFKPLVRNMSRLVVRYYWFSVGASVVCWMFFCLQSLIACPYFGQDASKSVIDTAVKSLLMTIDQ
jgi:hypothetical protein